MAYSVFAGAGQWRAAADDSRAQGLFGLDGASGARRGQVFGTEDGGDSWREYKLPDGVEGVYALACV